MQVFFLKLTPHDADSSQAQSGDEEGSSEHVRYWHGLLAGGTARAFGRVKHPDGPYFIAVVEADDDAAVQSLINDDPSNGTYTSEFYGMDRIHRTQAE